MHKVIHHLIRTALFRARYTWLRLHLNALLWVKVNEKDQAARLATEWAAVGLAIDRFCFWVYLVLIVATGMGTLIPPVPTEYQSAMNDEDLVQQFKELAHHTAGID